MPRSEWYHICAIGVLKTGAAYVPLDPTYPDERLSFILRDSGSRAVFAAPGTAERIRRISDLPVVDCTSLPGSPFEQVSVSPRDTAVILYTSGTTGTPKGVAVPHLAVESYAESFVNVSGLSEGEGILFYHSFGFDVHIKYIYAPVLVGARCDVLPEELLLDPQGIRDHVAARGLDVVDLPTSMIKLFIRAFPDLP